MQKQATTGGTYVIVAEKWVTITWIWKWVINFGTGSVQVPGSGYISLMFSSASEVFDILATYKSDYYYYIIIIIIVTVESVNVHVVGFWCEFI